MVVTTACRAGRAAVAGVACVLLAGSAAAADRDPVVVIAEAPPFSATVEPISAELAAEMSGVSWHPGCPIPIHDLRLITMPYRGFDGSVGRGELVVHEGVAIDVTSVFARLYAAGFPIRRMERIEAYGGDDDASMAADNTSAFNCREITGGGAMSIHSWGQAIDINTLENPYVRGDTVEPPAGVEFLDRGNVRPGMITDGDVAVTAFADIGFEWGGHWRSLKDYQHFEAAQPAGADEPAAGDTAPVAAEGCSPSALDSSAWTGNVAELVDLESGQLDVTAFDRFLDTAVPPVSVSPCDAARVLFHLDWPPADGETVVVVTEPAGPSTTVVSVTVDGLLDDSVAAVRYTLRFERSADRSISLAAGEWSQRCQPGRGHQGFSAEPCV